MIASDHSGRVLVIHLNIHGLHSLACIFKIGLKVLNLFLNCSAMGNRQSEPFTFPVHAQHCPSHYAEVQNIMAWAEWRQSSLNYADLMPYCVSHFITSKMWKQRTDNDVMQFCVCCGWKARTLAAKSVGVTAEWREEEADNGIQSAWLAQLVKVATQVHVKSCSLEV